MKDSGKESYYTTPDAREARDVIILSRSISCQPEASFRGNHMDFTHALTLIRSFTVITLEYTQHKQCQDVKMLIHVQPSHILTHTNMNTWWVPYSWWLGYACRHRLPVCIGAGIKTTSGRNFTNDNRFPLHTWAWMWVRFCPYPCSCSITVSLCLCFKY